MSLTSRKIYKGLAVPAAVPQLGGIHQADENKVVITSSGNRVTFLCICSKFSTSARNTPTVNNTSPRRIRLADLMLWIDPYACRITEVMMDIISAALDETQLALDRSFVFIRDAQEQLQQCPSSLGIWHFRGETRKGRQQSCHDTFHSTSQCKIAIR